MQASDLDGLPMLSFTRTPSDALALLASAPSTWRSRVLVRLPHVPVLLVVAGSPSGSTDQVRLLELRVGLTAATSP